MPNAPGWTRHGKRPKKFRPGEPVEDVGALVRHTSDIDTGYVYWFGNRPLHPRFVRSQQLQVILSGLRSNRIRYAELTDEWRQWAAEHQEVLDA